MTPRAVHEIAKDYLAALKDAERLEALPASSRAASPRRTRAAALVQEGNTVGAIGFSEAVATANGKSAAPAGPFHPIKVTPPPNIPFFTAPR